jgi:NADH:ubiquinone oxidoreductase subunit E
MMEKEKSRVPLIVKSLREKGFKLTSPRKIIIDVLENDKRPLSPEEIYIKATQKNQSIGIASVYRNINIFEELGIIEKSIDNAKKKYFLQLVPSIKIDTGQKGPALAKSKSRKNPPALSDIQKVSSKKSNNIDEIIKLQSALNKKILEFSRSRKEREIDLEELMNDFGKLDSILKRHDHDRGNLIQILLDCQEEYRWLPKHALLYITQKVDVPLAQAYSIASFYKSLSLEPKGKYTITVCAGTACHVRGSMNLLQRVVNILGIKPGDTTQDLKFTLDTVNCLGCCALGPVMLFNEKYYSDPDKKELVRLFKDVN